MFPLFQVSKPTTVKCDATVFVLHTRNRCHLPTVQHSDNHSVTVILSKCSTNLRMFQWAMIEWVLYNAEAISATGSRFS